LNSASEQNTRRVVFALPALTELPRCSSASRSPPEITHTPLAHPLLKRPHAAPPPLPHRRRARFPFLCVDRFRAPDRSERRVDRISTRETCRLEKLRGPADRTARETQSRRCETPRPATPDPGAGHVEDRARTQPVPSGVSRRASHKETDRRRSAIAGVRRI